MKAGTDDLKVLGDFEIHQVIGRGGMGTVYKARQRSLDRIVALKVLPNHISGSPKAVERFQREAHAAAKLHHTHIVPIFSRGETAGTYYYAMELVDGLGLNTVIAELRAARAAARDDLDLAETVPLPRASTMPAATPPGGSRSGSSSETVHLGATDANRPSLQRLDEIAGHIASIADALDYAHTQGVIHRDVKPHNLMLGNDGRMRIADFGLARIAELPGVTVTGEMVGSPLYMAPEQLSGGQAGADPRSDIYSLGATMYEWLTLSPPHPGDTRESVIGAILTADPCMPRTHDSTIPLDLETICLKAMNREPSRRYATAGDFRDDLKRYLEKRTIRARRAGPVEVLRKVLNRHQVAGVAVLASIMIASLSWALLKSKAQVQAKDEAFASLQQDVAEIQRATTRRNEDALIDAMRLADPFSGAGIDVISGVLDSGNLLAQGANLMLAPDPIDTASVSTPQGLARRAALDIYQQLVPSGYFDAGSISLHRSKTAYELGTPHDILIRKRLPSTALSLVSWYIERNGPDHESLLLSMVLHSELREYQKMAGDAEMFVRLFPNDPVGFLWRGLARLMVKDMPNCLSDLERASADQALINWRQTLQGIAFVASGKPMDGVHFLDGVLQRSPGFVFALLARASASIALGELAASIGFLDRAIEQEPDNANAVVVRGINKSALGRYEEAVADFEAATKQVGFSATILLRHKEVSARMQGLNRARPLASPDADESSQALPAGDAGERDAQRQPHWLRPDRLAVSPRPRGRRRVEGARVVPSRIVWGLFN